MKYWLLVFTFSFVYGLSQTSNVNLNRDLLGMKNAFAAKKFDVFANYLYPKSFDMVGGKTQAVNMLKMMSAQLDKQNVKIGRITHEKPGKMLKYKNEWQTTLEEVSEMQTPKGKHTTKSVMIAISPDAGKNWKFINTMGQAKDQILKLYPNLSPQLSLPAKPQNMQQPAGKK